MNQPAPTKYVLIRESSRMIRSVKALLIRDGYLVQILKREEVERAGTLNGRLFSLHPSDALEVIRSVRADLPRHSVVVLIPELIN